MSAPRRGRRYLPRMDLELRGKVALVTGASRGIGRAIALALAGEGARVVLCARGAADLEGAVAEARARGGSEAAALGVTADVTSGAGVAALIDAAVGAHGAIDIVVNNVGGSGARDFAATDEADLQAVLDRNLFPALRVSRAALPHLRARGGGVIVLIASVYGRESGGGPSYNVAKAAEISLAKAMARDLAREAIRVVSVAPGSILFPGGSWERRQQADPEGIAAFVAREIPSGRFGHPEEVGDVVAFLCSARASWITGACVPVDGGQSRAF
jgi:3-oxoacyl-[acyl-carrier protein] reductase